MTEPTLIAEVLREALEDVLPQIETWSQAYPLHIFPRPDLKRTAEVLSAAGLSLDRLSADAMRHVITEVWEMLAPVRAALSQSLPPAVGEE